MREGFVVLDQDYRIDVFADAVFVSKFVPDVGLERCEREPLFAIVFDNKIDSSVAKITYAVEKYDRTHDLILPQNIASPKLQPLRSFAVLCELGGFA